MALRIATRGLRHHWETERDTGISKTDNVLVRPENSSVSNLMKH